MMYSDVHIGSHSYWHINLLEYHEDSGWIIEIDLSLVGV